MSPPPFVIFALPRCRTAWLSRFLSYGGWNCAHDHGRFLRGVDDIKSWLATPLTGAVETSAAPFWRTLKDIAPDTRVVVLRRPVAECVESFMRVYPFDRAALTAHLTKLDQKLAQIAARWPGALSVTFADLASEETCARVFEHCLQRPHDPAWWSHLKDVNIQCDFGSLVRYYVAHRPQIDKLAATVRQFTLAGFERRPEVEHDAVTLAVEPLANWLKDAPIDTHMAIAGYYPDRDRLDADLLRRFEEIGALQCVLARSNGRVFGYLLTVIGPSAEAVGVLTGVHIPFYADPSFPGLGMRMQRFARDVLKDRGVTEIIMRAGVRGSGPRLGTLYRRLGAEDHGHLYRLNLE
jgi:hypothetical protein